MKTSTAPREAFTDTLRGFALLGIVLVNAPFLGISWVGFTPPSIATGADHTAAFLTVALAQAKFYVMFAFLFGYSLSFMLKPHEPDSRCRFYRRLLGLALIGAAHAVFFFIGDILVLYALLGLALPWLARKSDAFVRRAAWFAFAAWMGVLLLVVAAVWAVPDDGAAITAHSAQVDAVFAGGSFWEVARARLELWPSGFGLIATLNGLGVLAMFCVGLLAGRHKLLADVSLYRPFWASGLKWGFACGLPLSLLAAWLQIGPHADLVVPGTTETLGVALGFAAAPLLSWGYVSLLATLHIRRVRLLAVLQPEGRMSLTVYIAESAALSLIFCGYGLGWYGQLGAAQVTLIAVAVWAVLSVFAVLWQRRFAQGPLEALLSRFAKRADY
jgi:uncharacterized protein